MTQRRFTALASLSVLSLLALPAARLLAAHDNPPHVQITVDAPAAKAAPEIPSAPAASPAPRLYHRRRQTRAARVPRTQALPSRGVAERTGGAETALGRLAMVTSERASIHAGRERYNRVLSICPKGQYLAVNGETDTEYAVLMIDHTVGYISKSDVQILNYQVVASGPVGGNSDLGQRLIQNAQTYLGVPYVWGGESRNGIDCSGFVRAVFNANGISLPRVSRDQARVGYDVPHNVAAGDWQQWVPGDRMYFACHHPEIDHTAMYIGGGYFIHASAGHGYQVAIDRVDNAYYSRHLVAVRRSPELLGDTVSSPAMTQTASADSGSDHESTER